MQDKKTNKFNERGLTQGYWIYRYPNGNIANTFNYINGRVFGYSTNYRITGEITTNRYYAR